MKRLYELVNGEEAEIIDFEDNLSKCHSARFGLAVGEIIKCRAKLGPVVISKNQQVIAIGQNLSKKIYVKNV